MFFPCMSQMLSVDYKMILLQLHQKIFELEIIELKSDTVLAHKREKKIDIIGVI